MAKINPESIEGFKEMSAEEQVAALLNFEFTEPDEVPKLKAAMDKALSETAKAHREAKEIRDKWLSEKNEQERATIERAEADKKKDEIIARYEADARVKDYTEKFVESGYDLETAKAMAKALPAGVQDEYFAASKAFIDNRTKEIESAALSKQPGLSVGAPPTTQTAEKDRINELRHYAGLPPIK